MSDTRNDYAKANEYLTKNLRILNPDKDEVAWNVSTALGLLARAIQQDMALVKGRLAELNSAVEALQRRMPHPR
jgi:hypothetical protein